MMPALGFIEVSEPRWLPPLPLPLILLWPLVWACLGIARVLETERPDDAKKLRTAMQVFRELRGLHVDVETSDHTKVRIRFL